VSHPTISVAASPGPAARVRHRLRGLAPAGGLLLCLLLAGLALTMPGRPGKAAAPAPGPAAWAAADLSPRQEMSPTLWLPMLLQPPPGPGANLWLASYYLGMELGGEPVYTAVETRIDYDWGKTGHPPGVAADHFSARWEGDWELERGRYTFFLYADDGVRLWLDEKLLVDAWVPGMGSHPATVDVDTAGLHRLRLEYFEATGEAAVRLHWRRTDLYPRWEAKYYRLPWVEDGLMYKTLDDTIQFDWGLGAPAGLPDDGFSVAWTARRLFEPGTNRLYIYADDGYRLYLDGTLLGQGGWLDGQPGGQEDVAYSFEAAALEYHDVTYHFHDRGSLAEARLWLEYAEHAPWTAEYYPNRNLSGDPTVVRQEGAVFYDWGFGKARPALPSADSFSVRWTGERYFHSGCYRFGLFADDGVRLWVDGELLVDQWHDGRGEHHSLVKHLTQGLHQVVIEYYEASGEAEIRFWWE
jgi:hypothetical protein